MGYIIGATILWLVLRALKRTAASAMQAHELQEQHSPTRGHTTAERSMRTSTAGSSSSANSGTTNPITGRARETAITDHKGPFLQFRR